MDNKNTDDPHGYIREGHKMATQYMFRQHSKLKYITGALVGTMSGYSILVQDWIPFLGPYLLNFICIIIMVFMCMRSLNTLFAVHIKSQKTQTVLVPDLYKKIAVTAWILYGLGIIVFYWMAVLVYAALFMDLPASPPISENP